MAEGNFQAARQEGFKIVLLEMDARGYLYKPDDSEEDLSCMEE